MRLIVLEALAVYTAGSGLSLYLLTALVVGSFNPLAWPLAAVLFALGAAGVFGVVETGLAFGSRP